MIEAEGTCEFSVHFPQLNSEHKTAVAKSL